MIDPKNSYTLMQKRWYNPGTNNHEEHNNNPDYWNILLKDLKNKDKWAGKDALDFGCGKGRNVTNMLSLCDFNTVDGVDISEGNINHCKETYLEQNSKWFCNNGVDLQELQSSHYDFVMSTIVYQHICVYDIRRSLTEEIYRVLKPGGIFSLQCTIGKTGVVMTQENIEKFRVGYYDNAWDAKTTNSFYDHRVQDTQQIVDDFGDIGFKDFTFTALDSFADKGNKDWLYVRCVK
jgi:2-polyprenyl-3-methyl-5-hydroxy-6-metoxy-1,4-benzoquinol methylase